MRALALRVVVVVCAAAARVSCNSVRTMCYVLSPSSAARHTTFSFLFFFLYPSNLFSTPCFSNSLPVVTLIWGNIAIPRRSPTTVRAFIFCSEKRSAFSSFVASRRIVHTHAGTRRRYLHLYNTSTFALACVLKARVGYTLLLLPLLLLFTTATTIFTTTTTLV